MKLELPDNIQQKTCETTLEKNSEEDVQPTPDNQKDGITYNRDSITSWD